MRATSHLIPVIGLALLFGGCANTPPEMTYPASNGAVSSRAAADAAAAAAAAKAAADRRAAMAAQAAAAPMAAAGPVSERTVYFGYDEFTLDATDTDLLMRHARYLTGAAADTPVRVEGHADERGSVEYNLALGQKRADAVRRALTTLGVRDSRIEAISWGEQKPAAVGDTEEAYARNRRAELVYSSR